MITEKAAAPIIIEQVPVPVETTTTIDIEAVATSTEPTELLQDCPQAWYDNRMPMVIEPGQPRSATQYFIYRGERRELAEFDMNWVEANCSIEPLVVY